MSQPLRTPSVLSHSKESSSVGWFRSVLGLGAHRQHQSKTKEFDICLFDFAFCFIEDKVMSRSSDADSRHVRLCLV